MAKIFISHKYSDAVIAETVADRVKLNGFDVYLDSIDPAPVKDGPGLAEYLLRRMGECEQLIAVVSSSTALSWWVPWEIGVGSEKGFRMASYCSNGYIYLPTFLKKWPILRSMGDVEKYCELSRRSDSEFRTATARVFSDSALMNIRRRKVAEFHRHLKSTLALPSSHK